MAWLYVPESAGWSLASAPRASGSGWHTAPCVMSSGTPTPRACSWRGWATRGWIARLSGLTLTRSSARAGVDAWISSLPASPARATAWPASANSKTTRAICGPGRGEFCAAWVPNGSFWRTFQASLFRTGREAAPRLSLGSSESWPRTGGTRNGQLFLRAAWAPLTSASGCSCWPTPFGFQGGNGPDGNEFSTMVRQWPSPRSEDSENCGNHPGATDSLTGATRMWMTPDTPGGGRAMTREEVAANGMTENGKRSVGLENQTKFWQTPNQGMHDSRIQVGAEEREDLLPAQARKWPPPGSNDHKGSAKMGQRRGQLDEAVEQRFSPPVRVQTPSGAELSPTSRTLRRRLNPAFVCWLMGWPTWWTHPERISCAAAGMASWRSRLRWHLCICLGS